jgi:hypothetical protein
VEYPVQPSAVVVEELSDSSRPEDLSLTHNSNQDFSGTGSPSTTEILGIYTFNTSLEQL